MAPERDRDRERTKRKKRGIERETLGVTQREGLYRERKREREKRGRSVCKLPGRRGRSGLFRARIET